MPKPTPTPIGTSMPSSKIPRRMSEIIRWRAELSCCDGFWLSGLVLALPALLAEDATVMASYSDKGREKSESTGTEFYRWLHVILNRCKGASHAPSIIYYNVSTCIIVSFQRFCHY